MQSASSIFIIMKYSLVLCLLLVSLSTTIARKDGPNSDLRIVGGYEASLRSHPYIVSLQMNFLFMEIDFCAGSLLNERWILTAAHCFEDMLMNWLSVEAVVGTNDLKNKDSTAQILRISERVPHPNYDDKTFDHDIAMLKTEKDIQYNDAVYPIKFPLSIRGGRKTKNLITAGWGVLGEPKPPFFMDRSPEKLQEVRVEYMPFDECRKALDAASEASEDSEEVEWLSHVMLDRVGQICTGPITGGVSSCYGDSGGPLIQYISIKDITTDTSQITTEDIEYENTALDDNDSVNEELNDDTRRIKTSEDYFENTDKSSTRTKKVFEGSADIVQKYKDDGLIPVLIGVVSWGIPPCGAVGSPSVYTNVSTYADFIHKHLYD